MNDARLSFFLSLSVIWKRVKMQTMLILEGSSVAHVQASASTSDQR